MVRRTFSYILITNTVKISTITSNFEFIVFFPENKSDWGYGVFTNLKRIFEQDAKYFCEYMCRLTSKDLV